jgi:Outer membrane efflux protein
LLERRPDIRQAEEKMVAANAQLGVAKASFFPNLSLTGLGGLESNALHQFITAPAETWYAAFNVSQPVFEGGALRSGLRLARANWQESTLSYQQTVQDALEQVSNALIASKKNREFREQQELLTGAAQADRPAVGSTLQEWWRELPPSTDQRNKLLLGGTQPGAGAARRTASTCAALPVTRWRLAGIEQTESPTNKMRA